MDSVLRLVEDDTAALRSHKNGSLNRIAFARMVEFASAKLRTNNSGVTAFNPSKMQSACKRTAGDFALVTSASSGRIAALSPRPISPSKRVTSPELSDIVLIFAPIYFRHQSIT